MGERDQGLDATPRSFPFSQGGGPRKALFGSLQKRTFRPQENPHLAPAKRLPKTSSLEQAGWFKKLFKKIAKFFQKVVQAIVKAIQKVTQWITKALTAVFGKVIGGALAGIVNSIINILTFPVHVAYYASQGDWKGLLKYMANTALQIALIALNFIPGVGQVLYGALQFILQPLLALGKFLLGGLLQLAGAAFSGLGSFLGSFSQGIGGFFSRVGGSLTRFGESLVRSAQNFFKTGIKEIFAKLKSETFSLQKAATEFKKQFLAQINPVTYYKNLSQSVTESLKGLSKQGGLTKLLSSFTQKLTLQIAQQKIDHQIEKSKMSGFWKGVLSTVSSAGIQALGSAFFEGIFPSSQTPQEASRGRAPPTGRAGVVERIKNAFGNVAQVLKDAGGAIKSIFISESSSDSLSPAFEDLLQEKLASLDLDSEGDPYQISLYEGKAKVSHSLEKLPDGLSRADLGGGVHQILRIDPSTQQVLSNERVGNLETPAAFQNYFYDPRVGSYDLFPAANLQSSNPYLNSFLQGANDLNNVAGLVLNLGSNAFGYVDEFINRISRTTPEQRLFLALQNNVPGVPFTFADDFLVRGELAALKGIALAQKVFGVDRSVAKGAGPRFLELAHGGSKGKFRGMYSGGIDPSRFDPNARFGRGFYLAEDADTVIKEFTKVKGRGTPDLIAGFRLNFDKTKMKMLDLTDPDVKRAFKFDRRFSSKTRGYPIHQSIGEEAKRQGYNVIKYESFRNKGHYNYVVLDDFDELLEGRYPFR